MAGGGEEASRWGLATRKAGDCLKPARLGKCADHNLKLQTSPKRNRRDQAPLHLTYSCRRIAHALQKASGLHLQSFPLQNHLQAMVAARWTLRRLQAGEVLQDHASRWSTLTLCLPSKLGDPERGVVALCFMAWRRTGGGLTGMPACHTLPAAPAGALPAPANDAVVARILLLAPAPALNLRCTVVQSSLSMSSSVCRNDDN